MGHPLDDALLKVHRAKVHIGSLKRGINGFIKREPYTTSMEYDSERQIYELSVWATEEPPITWGLIVGDIVTNLRASLDYIAWQLSLISGIPRTEQDERSITFPIFGDTPPASKVFISATRSIATNARKVIEGFQPYYGGDSSPNFLLSILNNLARLDKHRILIPVFHQSVVTLTKNEVAFGSRFKQGSVLTLSKRAFDSMPKDQLDPKITVEIAIQDIEGLSTGFDVLLLDDIHDFIRYEIIPSFACFFPDPKNISV